MARYAQPDMEEPFAEFLRKGLEKWQPHLIVPIGSPAGRFVAKYRRLPGIASYGDRLPGHLSIRTSNRPAA
jgi:hypothetical protein